MVSQKLERKRRLQPKGCSLSVPKIDSFEKTLVVEVGREDSPIFGNITLFSTLLCSICSPWPISWQKDGTDGPNHRHSYQSGCRRGV